MKLKLRSLIALPHIASHCPISPSLRNLDSTALNLGIFLNLRAHYTLRIYLGDSIELYVYVLWRMFFWKARSLLNIRL